MEPEQRLSGQLELWRQGSESGPELKSLWPGQEQGPVSGLELKKELELELAWRLSRSWSLIQWRLYHESAPMDSSNEEQALCWGKARPGWAAYSLLLPSDHLD